MSINKNINLEDLSPTFKKMVYKKVLILMVLKKALAKEAPKINNLKHSAKLLSVQMNQYF